MTPVGLAFLSIVMMPKLCTCWGVCAGREAIAVGEGRHGSDATVAPFCCALVGRLGPGLVSTAWIAIFWLGDNFLSITPARPSQMFRWLTDRGREQSGQLLSDSSSALPIDRSGSEMARFERETKRLRPQAALGAGE
jgi:hypothetical protein